MDVAPANRSPAPPDAADRMGTDRIGPLLVRYSVPAIVGMLVNALLDLRNENSARGITQRRGNDRDTQFKRKLMQKCPRDGSRTEK